MARSTPQRLVALNWYKAGNARNAKGQYTTIANALIPLNERWSQKIRTSAREHLEASRVGPQDRRRKNGWRHLGPALGARENLTFSDTGFGFFRPDFMDKVTPYWRQIEEGSRVHVGRRQVMAFAGPFGEAIGPTQQRFRMDPWRTSGTGKGRVWKGTIRRPIGAHRFLRDAFEAWDREAYRKEWSRVVQRALREVARGG